VLGASCVQGPAFEVDDGLLGENAALSETAPVLRPVSRELAVRLAQRLRTLRTGNDPRPLGVAWAWAQLSCELRSAALEWSLARGPFAPDARTDASAPPLIPLTTAEVTMEALAALEKSRAYDAATIWVSGPLATRQTFVLPDGRTAVAPAPFDRIRWPVHIAAIVNVEGNLEVLDLSTGDAPMPIAQWTAQFTAPAIECPPVSLKEFRKIRSYWGALLQDRPPPAAPPRPCGWVYSSAFAADARWLREVPTMLPADTYLLERDLAPWTGGAFPFEEIPRVLARFEGLPWETN
jgi:hypothetical protein